MALFESYIGIDYSGASTAESSLPGLRVYTATALTGPDEMMPPISARKYWTRRGIANWLCEQLAGGTAAIVGIDHAFSFPLAYFKRHGVPLNWPAFLDDFQHHCPTDEANTWVDFIREGDVGSWKDRLGDRSWFRLTEQWTTSAKSVFQFDVQGSVAKSTYAGLPWLRYLRQKRKDNVHFWPFDGWSIPEGRSVVVEVYPSLWMRRFACDKRDSNQHAAFSVTAWLQRNDLNGSLLSFFDPPLTPQERETANIEGWILGVM